MNLKQEGTLFKMNKLWWFLTICEFILTAMCLKSGFDKNFTNLIIFIILLVMVVIVHKGLDGYINTGSWWG